MIRVCTLVYLRKTPVSLSDLRVSLPLSRDFDTSIGRKEPGEAVSAPADKTRDNFTQHTQLEERDSELIRPAQEGIS